MLRKYTMYLAGALALILGGTGCGESHVHEGWFDVAWNLGGRSCESMGIDLVTFGARNFRTQQDTYFDFNCVAYQGVTGGLPPGDYSVALYGYTPGNQNAVVGYIFPVTYPVVADYPTTLPEVTLVGH